MDDYKSLSKEAEAVLERYSHRDLEWSRVRYGLLSEANLLACQERQRALVSFLLSHPPTEIESIDLLEIGCGSGKNLLELIQLGFSPEKMTGVDVLSDRVDAARKILPSALRLSVGDALNLDIGLSSIDIVYQSLVFSSLLDTEYQIDLASRMWSWLRPGGAVLWYDFIYNNPFNPNVRGVPLKRIKHLFPEARIYVKRVTLAPPISRSICRIHPGLYPILNVAPWFRTHVLCWLQKS